MFLDHVYYLTWLVTHLLYALASEIIYFVYYTWKECTKRVWSCWPKYSSLADLVRIGDVSKTLRKVPRHVAFVITPEEEVRRESWILNRFKFLTRRERRTSELSATPELNLQALARVILWAVTAQVPVISLYDYNGEIKEKHNELSYYLREEISQNSWVIKRYRFSDEPPRIKFHNVSNKDGNANGVNGTKVSKPIHIHVYSNEDGKYGLLQTAKDIFQENILIKSSLHALSESQRSIAESSMKITESRLDSLLTRSSKSVGLPEPDLLIVLGSIRSTLGFLPWHIRLTEIHWVPKLRVVDTSDFLQVLAKYAGCQQRFGI